MVANAPDTTDTPQQQAPEKPVSTNVAEATTLTNPANSALAIRDIRSPSTDELLQTMPLSLVDNPVATLAVSDQATTTTAPTLDQKALDVKADELRRAINDKDPKKVDLLLETMQKADRDALVRTYQSNGSSLDADLRSHFNQADYTRLSAILNRTDGKTNDAGEVATTLARLRAGDKTADTELREVLATLSPEGIRQLQESYQRTYGQSLSDAINQTPNVSDATKQALPYLLKGVGPGGRTADDDVALANIAVKNKDIWLLSEALRGTGGSEVQARRLLAGNSQFQRDLSVAFGENPVAADIVRDGHTSIKTVIDANNRGLLGADNRSIDLALKNATDEERQQYARGRALAAGPKENLTEKQRQDLEFYTQTHDALINLTRKNEPTARDLIGDNPPDANKYLRDRLGLTQEQIDAYRTNPDSRQAIDDKAKGLTGVDQTLTQDLLAQLRGGKDVNTISPFDRVLYDKATGASPQRILLDAQAALADPEARQRYLSLFYNQDGEYKKHGGTDQDRARDQAFVDIIKNASRSVGASAREVVTGDSVAESLLSIGRMSLMDLARLGYPDSVIERNRALAGPQEQKALDQYFRDLGIDPRNAQRQVAKWEDELLTGGSLVSTIAEHAGKPDDVLRDIENMDRRQWERLTDRNSGAAVYSQLTDAINKFVDDPQKRQQALDLLRDKATARTYEDSQNIHRSILAVGTDANAVRNGILNLSPSEQARYANPNEKEFRAQVDDLVAKRLSGSDQTLARDMLDYLSKNGKLPQKSDLSPIDRVFYDTATGADRFQILRDVEAALKADPQLRQRLDKDPLLHPGSLLRPNQQMDPKERLLAETINKLAGDLASHAKESTTWEGIVSSLLQTGELNIYQRVRLDEPKQQLYADIAALPPNEREGVERYARLSKDQIAIIDQIAANPGGKPDLADRLRSFVVGDDTKYSDYESRIRALSPEQLQQLKSEYARKYGHDFDLDFLSKVDEKDQINYRNLLSPTRGDGRQDYFDSLGKLLRSENGYGSAGTQANAERALQLYGEALQSASINGKPLSPEVQDQLNKYFGEALQNYKDSKEELAKQLIELGETALLFGSGILAIAASGGTLSPAVLAVIVGAGASLDAGLRVKVLQTVLGNDFDGSVGNVLKQAGIGFANGLITFGPIAAPEIVARIAGRATKTIIEGTVLSETATKAVSAEVDNAIARATASGTKLTQADVDGIVARLSNSGTLSEQEIAAVRQRVSVDSLNKALDAERLGAAPELIDRAARAQAPKPPESVWTLPNGQQVDPVTRQILENAGLTPDSVVYRTMDPRYLDAERGLVAGNPNSMALVQDSYNPITMLDANGQPFLINGQPWTRPPAVNAREIGPGLNVAALDPSIYGNSGQTVIAIKVSDILAAGGRVYDDIGAAAGLIRPLYFTFDGSVPYTVVSAR